MTGSPALIAIDWGSSSFRAFLLSGDGRILEQRRSNKGAFQITEYENTLAEMCGSWLADNGNLPIRMGGSIGSRNGWQETGYIECPVAPHDMKEAFVPVENSLGWDIAVLPGVSVTSGMAECDVMRGEEIQIFGAMQLLNQENGWFCLPGTHSKWCRVEKGQIVGISSFLTGEMYALLMKDGSLSSLVTTKDYDESAFRAGLQAIGQRQNLLKLLFRARAGVLLDQYQADQLPSFLSGALIGYEIDHAVDVLNTAEGVVIVASAELATRYQLALQERAQPVSTVAGEKAFLAGMQLLVA